MKRLIKLLLIVPLVFIIGTVNAATIRYTQMESRPMVVSIPGYSYQNYFYKFKLDGTLALCIEHGKHMSNGLPYKLAYAVNPGIESDNAMMHAYLYAERDQSDKGLLAAQVIAWTKTTDINKATDFIASAFKSNKFSTSNARDYAQAIMNTNINGVTLYVWEYDGINKADYQKLITSVPGTPTGEKCRLTTVDESAVCEGNTNSNFGVIYQSIAGDCEDKYVEGNYNASGAYMKKYGDYCKMYCLESFSETYPGNIATAVSAGRYIVWPNNNINSNIYKINAKLAKYPLSTKLSKSCKIYVDQDTVKKSYNNAKSEMNKYKTYAADYLNDGCSSLESDYNSKNADAESKSNYGNAPSNNCGQKAPAGCKTAYEAELNAYNSRKGAYDDAKKEADDAKEKLDACKAYGNAYKAAQSVISQVNNCATTSIDLGISYNINYTSNYGDKTYGGTTFNTYVSNTTSSCIGCSSDIKSLSTDPNKTTSNNLVNKANEIQERTIVGSVTKSYDITESSNGSGFGYYYYVDKKNNQSVHSYSGLTNYSTIGFSNMPTSYDSKGPYELKLNAQASGTSFDSTINNQKYACKYEAYPTPPPPCICPEGSARSGQSLECYYINNSDSAVTCPDLIEKYCYTDSIYVNEPLVCGDDDYLNCPDGTKIDEITACVRAGSSLNSCRQQYCGGNGEDYRCPRGTMNEGSPINGCVSIKRQQGLSIKEAYNSCVEIDCNGGKGKKIIYRTISLTNPFPSYDADSTVTQTGLRVGMFNDTVKGRYPGYNWNGQLVVKNKILNNRGVDGEKVYTKEPLYKIVLDTAKIKEIRRYNNKQKDGYSDFTLKCLINNSSACRSQFLHNPAHGLVGGTCYNVSKGNFYTCDD